MNDEREEENRFFECAINHLKYSALSLSKEEGEKYCFIYFHDFFISGLLNRDFFENRNDKKIIIISTSRMKPLALFYLNNLTNVLAIIDASESVRLIIEKVRSIHRDIETYKEYDKDPFSNSLSGHEVKMLTMILDGNSIQYIARRLNVPIKTAYGHSHVIAKKLGVRKLHDLIIAR